MKRTVTPLSLFALAVALCLPTGKWMAVNGDAIYGTTCSPVDFDFWWGAMAQKGQTVYLHVLQWKPEGIEFHGLVGQPSKAYFLHDKQKTPLALSYDAAAHVTKITVAASAPDAPDARNTVIAVEYDALIVADPNAKGSYYWYTNRRTRHTELGKNKGGKADLPPAVKEARSPLGYSENSCWPCQTKRKASVR